MQNSSGLVIFDVDGTLVQSVDVDDRCFVDAVQEVFGINDLCTNWAAYHYQTDSGLSVEICRRYLDRDPSLDELARLRLRFLELLETRLNGAETAFEPTTGIFDLLEHLRRQIGWNMAIATGGWEVSARAKLRVVGIGIDEFPFASADDAMERIEIIRMAVRRAEAKSNCGFSQIAYVGDGVWDVQAARSLEIGFIGVAEKEAAQRLEDAGAAVVIRDFSDVAAFEQTLASLKRQTRTEFDMK